MVLHTARYDSVYDPSPSLYPISTIALEMRKGTATLPDHVGPIRKLKDVTQYARDILKTRGRAPYDLIKQGMPQFSPAVTLDGMSGLCCLEYDDSDVDTAFAFSVACKNPHVVMVWRSLSEKPKIIVRIATENLTRLTFPHAWLTASLMFEEIGDADVSASRPHQLQNICYDPDLYLNPDAVPLGWSVDEESLSEVIPHHDGDIVSALVAELGREYVDALAEMDYTEQGVGRQRVPCPFERHESDGWGSRSNATRVIKNGENDWTLQCFKCGTRKRYSEVLIPLQKLQRAETPSTLETESLTDNEVSRETSIATQLTFEKNQTQIHLVSDVTGSGKSHTTLAESKNLQKRVIGVLPHTDLARQAVEVAHEVGFFSPYHLKGRDVNWDESGIEAIPIPARTEELFGLNPCVMVDKIREYTEKRIAGRTYCEHDCAFRKECLEVGHLSQYKDLDNIDFLATCMPNLLFNPEAHGYLKMLVTRGKKEPTEVDDVLSDAFGLEADEEKSFDMAIVDDYTIDGLYNDCIVQLDELKALRDAWAGEIAGVFAEKLLPAFLETETVRMYQVLIGAVENLTGDEREQLRSQLSQHARRGHIQYAPKKFLDADRKVLSRYVVRFADEGVLYIAQDKRAFAALQVKGVPVILSEELKDGWKVGDSVVVATSIVRALMSGIALSDISPVWHRNWTLLDQILSLKQSVGTPENAPVFLIDNTLHFSVPPQDAALLDHIYMLSPQSTEPRIRSAFQGQDVEISAHTGQPIEFAEDVKIYQAAEHRLTAASVLEYPSSDGKRQLDKVPTTLKAKTLQRFEKLNVWAGQADGVSCFISYKDIVEHFTEPLSAFDVVTHFDKMAGLNLDGLAFLVVYGYPKVKHEVVVSQALTQFASDTTPLPTGTYDELTETRWWDENGLSIFESRYTDSRLDAIRVQLSIDKLQQAIGRARHVRWKGTTTFIFTNAIVPTITERATLFTDKAFLNANHLRDIEEAGARIAAAKASGDAKAYQKATGVSERTAYRHVSKPSQQNKADRDAADLQRILEFKSENPELGERKIALALGISYGRVRTLLKNW